MPLLQVEDRSPEVQAVAAKFEMGNLVSPDARQMGGSFARLAQEIIFRIRGDEKEELLAATLEALHTARTYAISAVLPAVRRPQFEGNAEAKPVPELPSVDETQEPEEPQSTEHAPTARSKTARTRTAAAAR